MLSEDSKLLAERIYVQMLARRITGTENVAQAQAALDARASIEFAETFLEAWKERVKP
jgi:hypothetical protein